LDSYKSQLKESTANDLYSALELIKQHSIIDVTDARPFSYAKKIDSIDQYPRTEDVIKDYPFLQEWWNEQ
jgi:hypothetical protein